MNPVTDTLGAYSISLPDPLRDRHPELGHAVDHRTSHLRFALLRRYLPSAQRGPDEDLVAEHRGFDKRSLPVAHGFLPTPPPLLLDKLDLPVPGVGA
jgi:hypothetical protein